MNKLSQIEPNFYELNGHCNHSWQKWDNELIVLQDSLPTGCLPSLLPLLPLLLFYLTSIIRSQTLIHFT